MADEYQAGKMILAEIGMFNDAAHLLEEVVQPAVLGAIDECVETFVNTELWGGNFKLAGDERDCWLAPAQWIVGKDKNGDVAKAWFSIDKFKDKEDYWTALLCGHGSAECDVGFVFRVDPGVFGTVAAWSKYLSGLDQEKVSVLVKNGFKLGDNEENKKTFFLPIRLDSKKLADIWGDRGQFAASDDCFEPVKEALEKLKMAWPIFDDILKSWPVKT